MRAVLQRVRRASVTIDQKTVGEIGNGILLLLGISERDGKEEVTYLAEKCVGLRIFEDSEGKMNRSLADVGGKMLIVSQFTLYADCKKGKRPSFTGAARPEHAIPLYESFIETVEEKGINVQTGVFGADMLVSLENDGPVTILLDTEEIMPRR